MSNIDKVKPSRVYVTLNSRVRELKYDLNAFGELEKRFGSVEIAMNELQKGSMTSIKTILWVGLIHEEAVIDPITGDATSYNITPYQVGSWIDPRTLSDVTTKLMEAIDVVMPEVLEAIVTDNVIEIDPNAPKVATVVYTPEELKELEKKD